jgi:hypothetical protein
LNREGNSAIDKSNHAGLSMNQFYFRSHGPFRVVDRSKKEEAKSSGSPFYSSEMKSVQALSYTPLLIKLERYSAVTKTTRKQINRQLQLMG